MPEWMNRRCRLVVERNIPFEEVGGQTLTLDVWREEDQERRAGVFMVIGGGWHRALRSNFDNLAGIFASWGYVVCNATYRVAPAHPWPAALQDVKTALRWWRAHAEDHGLDPAQVASFGSSAGAHLSAMLAVTPGDEPFGGSKHLEQTTRVQAAVCLCAPVDMHALYELKGEKQVLLDFLAGSPGEVPDHYTEASPVSYFSGDAAPTLFIHGEEDPIVPIEPTRQASERLAELGAESHFVALPQMGHGLRAFMTTGGDASPMPRVQRFLARHLGGARAT